MIRVDFACNDPANGNETDRFAAVHWGGSNDNGLELAYEHYGIGLKFTDDGDRIRILRRWYPYARCKAWYGNWCWNAYWFQPPVAKAMLRHLRASGKFSCVCGPTRLFEWWDLAGSKRRDDAFPALVPL